MRCGGWAVVVRFLLPDDSHGTKGAKDRSQIGPGQPTDLTKGRLVGRLRRSATKGNGRDLDFCLGTLYFRTPFIHV